MKALYWTTIYLKRESWNPWYKGTLKAFQMNGTAVNTQHALQQKYIGPYTPKDTGNGPAMTVVKDEMEAKSKLVNFVSLLWLQHLKLHLSVPLCFCNSMECISGLMLCSQLSTTSLQIKGCLTSNSKVQHWINLQHAGALHLLEQEFSALPLWCKAGDGPHFDLNASVELLVPHVPYSLDWCGYCFVLPVVRRAVLLTLITFSYSNNTQYQYINWVGGRDSN